MAIHTEHRILYKLINQATETENIDIRYLLESVQSRATRMILDLRSGISKTVESVTHHDSGDN